MLKLKKGFFVVVGRWWKQPREIVGFFSEVFNENYIAGEKIENVDQTELYFALIIPEIDFPLNFA